MRADGLDSGSSLSPRRVFRELGRSIVPPILGRAIVLDVAALHGCERLPDGHEIGIDELESALRTSKQSVDPVEHPPGRDALRTCLARIGYSPNRRRPRSRLLWTQESH